MRRFLDDSAWYSLGVLQIVLFVAWLFGASIDWWLMLTPIYILILGFTGSIITLLILAKSEEFQDDSNG